jgi:hypothetical protein
MTRDLTARHRRRKPVVCPHRAYRDFLSKNLSPEVSAELVTQRHGDEWLIFGLAVPA